MNSSQWGVLCSEAIAYCHFHRVLRLNSSEGWQKLRQTLVGCIGPYGFWWSYTATDTAGETAM